MSLEDLVVFNLKSLHFHQPGIKKVGEIILFHLQLFFINKNNSFEAYWETMRRKKVIIW